jgi:hypothetical protein
MGTYLEIVVSDGEGEEDKLLSFYINNLGFSVYLRNESEHYSVICSSGLLCASATDTPILIVIRRKTSFDLDLKRQNFHFYHRNPTVRTFCMYDKPNDDKL